MAQHNMTAAQHTVTERGGATDRQVRRVLRGLALTALLALPPRAHSESEPDCCVCVFCTARAARA
eukprot:1438266-Rhodomonas_salina.1